jgi:hypothetical protein
LGGMYALTIRVCGAEDVNDLSFDAERFMCLNAVGNDIFYVKPKRDPPRGNKKKKRKRKRNPDMCGANNCRKCLRRPTTNIFDHTHGACTASLAESCLRRDSSSVIKVSTVTTITGSLEYVFDIIGEQSFPPETVKYVNSARTLSSTFRSDKRQCRECVFVRNHVPNPEDVCENCGTCTSGCSKQATEDPDITVPDIHTRKDCLTWKSGSRCFLKNTHGSAYGRICHGVQVEGKSEYGITKKRSIDEMRVPFTSLHMITRFGQPRML